MSGHWRFCVGAALLFVAGLPTSPAFSNPLTDLFNSAPKEATAPALARDAPAPAREECLLQPGKSTTSGQHWVYHLDGHRKCWFQAAGGAVSVKKPVPHHAANRSIIASEENEAGLHKRVADARAQLLRSAPGKAFQLAAPASEVVDTASAPANGAATLVPVVPIVAEPTIDLLTPDHATPRSIDVELLLAVGSPARDTLASSVPPATPGEPFIPHADQGQWELMATRAGMALITLGLVSLLAALLLANGFRDPPHCSP